MARGCSRSTCFEAGRPRSTPGVFLVVAWLELYGTAIGTWRWAAEIPGTSVSLGNPPSGVASGYVWFDIVALAVAPRLLTLVHTVRKGRVRALTPATSADDTAA